MDFGKVQLYQVIAIADGEAVKHFRCSRWIIAVALVEFVIAGVGDRPGLDIPFAGIVVTSIHRPQVTVAVSIRRPASI